MDSQNLPLDRKYAGNAAGADAGVAPHVPDDGVLSRQENQLVPFLIGTVYSEAPLPDKAHLLEQLMRPLGILSLVAIANGIFADIRIQTDWSDLPTRLAQVQRIDTRDVVALASFAQEVSIQAVNGLTAMITASPALAGSAAALMLVQILRARRPVRRHSDRVPT